MDHSGDHEWDIEALSRLVVWLQDLTLVLVWLSFTVRWSAPFWLLGCFTFM